MYFGLSLAFRYKLMLCFLNLSATYDFTYRGLCIQGSFGEILRAYWRGTPVAVKRILPSLSDDRLVM